MESITKLFSGVAESFSDMSPTMKLLTGLAAGLGLFGGAALGGIAWAIGGTLLALAAVGIMSVVNESGLPDKVDDAVDKAVKALTGADKGPAQEAGLLGVIRESPGISTVAAASIYTVARGGGRDPVRGVVNVAGDVRMIAEYASWPMRTPDRALFKQTAAILDAVEAEGRNATSSEIKTLEKFKSRLKGWFGGDREGFLNRIAEADGGSLEARSQAKEARAKHLDAIDTLIEESKANPHQAKGMLARAREKLFGATDGAAVDAAADVEANKATPAMDDPLATRQYDTAQPGPDGPVGVDADAEKTASPSAADAASKTAATAPDEAKTKFVKYEPGPGRSVDAAPGLEPQTQGQRSNTNNTTVATADIDLPQPMRNRGLNGGVNVDIDQIQRNLQAVDPDFHISPKGREQIAQATDDFNAGKYKNTPLDAPNMRNAAGSGLNGLAGGLATVISGMIVKDALAQGRHDVAAAAAGDALLGSTAVADDMARAVASMKPEMAAKFVDKLAQQPKALQAFAKGFARVSRVAGVLALPAAVVLDGVLEEKGYKIDRMTGTAIATSAAAGFAYGSSAVLGGAVVVPIAGAVTISYMVNDITTNLLSHDKVLDKLKADLDRKTNLKQLMSDVLGDTDVKQLFEPEARNKIRDAFIDKVQKNTDKANNNDSPRMAAAKDLVSVGMWGGYGDKHMEAQFALKSLTNAYQELEAWEKQHLDASGSLKAELMPAVSMADLDVTSDNTFDVRDLDRDGNGKIDQTDKGLLRRDVVTGHRDGAEMYQNILDKAAEHGIQFKGEKMDDFLTPSATPQGNPQMTSADKDTYVQ